MNVPILHKQEATVGSLGDFLYVLQSSVIWKRRKKSG
jgi:hypothetical protein